MENFIYSIPTEIYFGKGQIANIGRIVSGYGRKALLVYGGGSIKRNGIYDDVVKIFKENGIAWCELSGVEPNPRITTVREGVKLCREEGVEVLVPIGGGSTIDCAKVIAGAVSYDGDAWDIVLNPAKVVSVLPIVTVLTLRYASRITRILCFSSVLSGCSLRNSYENIVSIQSLFLCLKFYHSLHHPHNLL